MRSIAFEAIAFIAVSVALPVAQAATDSERGPFPNGTPHAIPGRIEAAHYDRGGAGVAYHDTTPGNTGKQLREDDVDIAGGVVGWTADGEWLEYSVNAHAGIYDVLVYAACGLSSPGRLRALLGDKNLLLDAGIPATGSWEIGYPLIVRDVAVPAGKNVLRVEIVKGGFNLDGLYFKKHPGSVEPRSRLIARLESYQPQTLVIYGTSLSAHYGGRFIPEIERRYKGIVKGVNSAKPSMWSQWGVENLDERVIAKKPDAVFIEFAVNDAFLPYQTSVEQARKNLENMIARVSAANPECEIILLILIPPIGEHLKQRPQVTAYYDMYRRVAQERRLLLIDVYPEFKRILDEDPDRFKRCVPDGIHPGEEGCDTIITPAILRALGAEPSSLRSGSGEGGSGEAAARSNERDQRREDAER